MYWNFTYDYDNEHFANLQAKFYDYNEKGTHTYFELNDLLELADFYFKMPDEENLDKVLQLAIKQYADTVTISLITLKLKLIHNDLEGALAICQQIELFKSINQSEITITKGVIAAFQRDYDTMLKEFYNYVTSNPLTLENRTVELNGFFATYEIYDQNIKFIDMILPLRPHSVDLWLDRAFLSRSIGWNEEAITSFNKVLDINPYHTKTWDALGTLYFQMEDYKNALNAYEYAAAISSSNPFLIEQVAHCYFNLENYEEAKNRYIEHLKIFPGDSFGWSFLGECYENTEEFDVAFDCFQKAVTIDDNNFDGWLGLAICYINKENYDKAYAFLQKALTLNTSSAELFGCLGEVCAKLNLDTEALGYLLQSVEIEPNQAETWAATGLLYMKMHHYSEALNCFETALLQDIPPYDRIYLNMAVCYYMTDDKNNAMIYLDLAAETISNAVEIFIEVIPDAKNFINNRNTQI